MSKTTGKGLRFLKWSAGIAVGLVVLAASVLVVTGQLTENRRLLLDTQLQQDLRATADIITRQLRRAGATNGARATVWQPGVLAHLNHFSGINEAGGGTEITCLLYTSPSPRDRTRSRMPSSA